ncbi:MAG TPA: hypothetical protein VF954_06695, partial [Acidimicrobiales bacterium]
MDVDVDPMEHELCRIPEVTAARIVVDGLGEVAEVHILATPTKQPKQVVRDVQSVAVASFGVELDRRIISVVQLEDRAQAGDAGGNCSTRAVQSQPMAPEPARRAAIGDLEPGAASRARVVVDGVAYARNGYRCSVEVSLRLGEERAVGQAEGAASSGSASRLAAAATLS